MEDHYQNQFKQNRLPPLKQPEVNLDAMNQLKRIIDQTGGDVDMDKVQKHFKKQNLDFEFNTYE